MRSISSHEILFTMSFVSITTHDIKGNEVGSESENNCKRHEKKNWLLPSDNGSCFFYSLFFLLLALIGFLKHFPRGNGGFWTGFCQIGRIGMKWDFSGLHESAGSFFVAI